MWSRILFLFIGMVCCSPVLLRGQEVAAVSFTKVKEPLEKVLEDIERQAGIVFSYESSVLEDFPPVTLKVDAVTVEECLERLFDKRPVMYQLNGRVVILKKKPRQVVISGFVRAANSSESLIGASVFDKSTQKGTATNSYGFFSLALDPGDIHLHISYIGYQGKTLPMPFMERDTLVTILLEEGSALPEVVVLSGKETQQHLTTQMGALTVNQQTIRQAPVLLGEADVIKTLQMMPGVANGVEGFAGLYVRGGNLDENLFLIDGNPVYQINHLGGIFSAFNREVIRGMDFFKAGFPARYGGRLSSVVDVYTKEGNMKKFHGSASIGLIAANLNIEGPIIKDRTSFAISFRRTWMDAILKPMLALQNNMMKDEGEKIGGNYFFHDLNVKLDHRFSERSRMYVSLYSGNDKVRAETRYFDSPLAKRNYSTKYKSRMEWGNLMATAGWTHIYNPKLFGRISAFYTRYRSSMKQQNTFYGDREDVKEIDIDKLNSLTKNITGISDFGFRSSFDYMPSPAHRIRFGGDAVLHRFRPEYSVMKAEGGDNPSIGGTMTDELFWGKEFGLFAEDDWHLSPAFRINVGSRYSLFHIDRKTYMQWEPRVSLRWLLRDDLSMKLSYARMSQYVHLLATSYIQLPTDAWMPVTRRLKPLVCDHLSAGLYYDLMGQYDFSVEGYYKHFDNLLDYKDGYTLLPTGTPWDEKVTRGTGRGYGVEFMAHRKTGRTTGWIGYTLSWADRKFAEIDEGRRFPSRFDNRHKLNIVLMHKLSPKVELSAAWTYSTGNRMTISLDGYEIIMPTPGEGEPRPSTSYGDYYEGRNNYRLPAYHRLDLGINIYRPKKKGRMGIWNVSVYNAYCRMNPFMVYKEMGGYAINYPDQNGYYYTDGYTSQYKKLSILPIVPSVSYTYKF